MTGVSCVREHDLAENEMRKHPGPVDNLIKFFANFSTFFLHRENRN